jgi:hypothetical protein
MSGGKTNGGDVLEVVRQLYLPPPSCVATTPQAASLGAQARRMTRFRHGGL